MDPNTSWDSSFDFIQPQQMPSSGHPPNTNADAPKHPSSERVGELMKRVLELEGVIEELKAQIAAEVAPGHQTLDTNVHQSQIGESSGRGSKRAAELDRTDKEGPSQLNSKRRRLNYTKCTFCRKAKKKCSPNDRVWPSQKCDRCAEMGLDCSAGVTKKPGGEARDTRPEQPKPSQEDQSPSEPEKNFFDWGLVLPVYEPPQPGQPQYMDYPYPPLIGAPLSSHYGPVSHDPAMMYSIPPVMQIGGAPHQHDNQGHVRVVQSRPKPQCWEHGCNGRQFSTFSSLLRHQREKSVPKATCPDCGAEFTRTTARNGHLLHQKCKSKRRLLPSVTRGDSETGQLSSILQLRSGRRILRGKVKICLKS